MMPLCLDTINVRWRTKTSMVSAKKKIEIVFDSCKYKLYFEFNHQ